MSLSSAHISASSDETDRYQSRKRSAGVTMADVAAKAGVSMVAVSVALNKSTSKARVSDATRERIQEVARSMGYHPNMMARSLRMKRTNVLGFYNSHDYILEPTVPFFGAILAGIERGCEEHQKDLLLRGVFRGSNDDEVMRTLMNGQVDGLILYAQKKTNLTERIAEAGLPVVSVVNAIEGIPSVISDDQQGAELLVRHLAERGYRRILYRHAPYPSMGLIRRCNSFQESAKLHGLEVIVSEAPEQPGFSEIEAELMKAPPSERPDAIMGYNDSMADDAALQCRELGLSIPGDVAIVGYDALGAQRRPALQLTTIDPHWIALAEKAVSILVASCAGESVPMRTELPVSLKKGETT